MRAEAKHGAIGACVALFLTSYVILATKLFSTHSFHDQVAVLVTLIAAGSSSYVGAILERFNLKADSLKVLFGRVISIHFASTC